MEKRDPTDELPIWDQWRALAITLPLTDLARHASVGRQCRCRNCFCCAALSIHMEMNSERRRDSVGGRAQRVR
jgi:hypothetical protein